MECGNFFEDLTRRAASDNILHDKAFNTAKNPKYNGHQRGLASIVYKFFDKNPLCLQINLLLVVVLEIRACLRKNYQKNYTNQLFKNL